jgi:branched-chain amino acid transport system permease protein
MTRNSRVALSLFGVAALAAVPAFADTYRTNLASEILIFGVLALALDILVGYAGRPSLCHGAIFGTAAYTVIYWVSTGGSLWLGVILAVAAATVLAAVFAVLAVRTTGAYFLLLTLALGMIVWGVCLRWTSVTGGENGMRATLRPDYLTSPGAFYYMVLAMFILSAALMWRVVHSPFGLSLRGLRDSESRMRALGYAVPLQAFIGFVISGLFAGLAGVLFAMFNGFVSPSSVALSQSVSVLLMVIIGGAGTLFGGLIGAGLITVVADRVSVVTDRWSLVLGLLFIATMMVAPDGILGFFRARAMTRDGLPDESAEQRRTR